MENGNWEDDDVQPISTTLQTYQDVEQNCDDASLRLGVMMSEILWAQRAQKMAGDPPQVNAMEGFAVIGLAPMQVIIKKKKKEKRIVCAAIKKILEECGNKRDAPNAFSDFM